MDTITIYYNDNGTQRTITVPVTPSAVHEEELMKYDFIKLSWNDAEKYSLPVDSYIEPFADGVRYSLLEPYEPSQVSECEYKYEPEFQHRKMYLGKVTFTRPSKDSDNKDLTLLDWPYTGDIATLLGYFTEQMNSALGLSGDDEFSYSIIGTLNKEIITVSFNTQDILSALTNVANACECEWHIEWSQKTLYFGRVIFTKTELTPFKLTVGENISTPSVRNSKKGYWNAYEPQGSTRNITRRAASGEHVQSNVRLSLREYITSEYPYGKYPDGILYTDGKGHQLYKNATQDGTILPGYYDENGNLVDFSETQYIKSVIFEDIYPKLDLYAYNVKHRERYLLDETTKEKVVDYIDEHGVKHYKRYAVWYMKLAYPFPSKNDITEWRDYTVTEDDVIDGKKLYGQFRVNTYPNAESTPLAGRGNGDEGNYGFELISLATVNSSYIKEANKDPKEEGDTGIIDNSGNRSSIDSTYYEIVFQESDGYILPSTKSLGVVPNGFSTNPSYNNNEGLKGNIVNLYNIVMSSDYELAAKGDLETETMKHVLKDIEDNNSYSFHTNPVVFEDLFREDTTYNRDSHLYIGQMIHYVDGSTYLDNSPLTARVQKLTTNLDCDFIQEITIGNEIIKGSTQTLKEQIETLISGGSSGAVVSDSVILRVVQNWVTPRFISKLYDDAAQGLVGFVKGIWIKTKGVFGFDEAGNIRANDINADGAVVVNEAKSQNYTGDGIADTGWRLSKDTNGTTKLVVDYIYARIKLIAEALELKKYEVSAGDQIFTSAANYISKTDYIDGNGKVIGYSTEKIPWLLNRIALVIGKNPLGDIYARYRTIRTTLTSEQLNSVSKVRCYFLAEDDDRTVENWWRVGDLARCQTMNLVSSQRNDYSGSVSKQGNVMWWRRVVGVSSNAGNTSYNYVDDEGNIYSSPGGGRRQRRAYNGTKDSENNNNGPVTIDGKKYHYVDVAYNHQAETATPYSYPDAAQYSDIPCAGDTIVQFGNVSDSDRMNAMTLELNGLVNYDAPCIKIYRGIYTFSLERSWWGGRPLKMKLSPATGFDFFGPSFRFIQEYGTEKVPTDRGEWSNIPQERDDYSPHSNVRKCYYYDRVAHNGSLWLCVDSTKDMSSHWTAETGFTENGNTYQSGDYISDSAYEELVLNKTNCIRKTDYTTIEPGDTTQDQQDAWQKQVSKGDKGDDGTSPYTADIDNDMDSIRTSDGGVPVSSQSVQSNIRLFKGSTQIAITSFAVYDTNSSGEEYQSGTWKNGILVTKSISSGTGSITITFSTSATIQNGKKVFCLSLTNSTEGVSRLQYFTINAINGDIYNVQPVSKQFNVGRTTSGGYTPSTLDVKCGYTKKDIAGNITSVSHIPTRSSSSTDQYDIDGKYNLYFRTKSRIAGTWSSYSLYSQPGSSGYNALASLSTSSTTTVEFVICTNTALSVTESNLTDVIDKESVPIVADGMKGDSAVTYRCKWQLSGTEVSSLASEAGGSIKNISSSNKTLVATLMKRVGSDAETVFTGSGRVTITAGNYSIYTDITNGQFAQSVTLSGSTLGVFNDPTLLHVTATFAITGGSTETFNIDKVYDGASITGKTGPSYYYKGEWRKSGDDYIPYGTVIRNTDYERPFVSDTNTSTGAVNYYMFIGTTLTVPGTPRPDLSQDTDNWAVMSSENKYLIAKAIFSQFAKLGSAIFNGDWIYSQHGKLYYTDNNNVVHFYVIDNTSNSDDSSHWKYDADYPASNGRKPYTYFNPAHPYGMSEYTGAGERSSDYPLFAPSWAVDLLSGKSWMKDSVQRNAIFTGFHKSTLSIIDANNPLANYLVRGDNRWWPWLDVITSVDLGGTFAVPHTQYGAMAHVVDLHSIGNRIVIKQMPTSQTGEDILFHLPFIASCPYTDSSYDEDSTYGTVQSYSTFNYAYDNSFKYDGSGTRGSQLRNKERRRVLAYVGETIEIINLTLDYINICGVYNGYSHLDASNRPTPIDTGTVKDLWEIYSLPPGCRMHATCKNHFCKNPSEQSSAATLEIVYWDLDGIVTNQSSDYYPDSIDNLYEDLDE